MSLLPSRRSEGEPRELQASQPYLDPWNCDVTAHLETISSHVNDRKVIRGSHCGVHHGEVVPGLPGILLG